MSVFNKFSRLDKQNKRFIWVGYIIYMIYIWPMGGYDDVLEKLFDNDILVLISALGGLYWGIIFLVLWTLD